MSDVCVAL